MLQTPIDVVSVIEFPCYESKVVLPMRTKITSVTKKLRDAYYNASPTRETVYTTPFGGPISDSIGPWPEFILRGLPCQKSTKGCCTPCFYSRMPQVKTSRESIYDSLVEQVNYVIRNFNALVMRNQLGPVTHNTKKKPVSLVLTPTGSFFDEREFPISVRNQILSLLLEQSQKLETPFTIHIETHAEDYLRASEIDGFDDTIELLKSLYGRILFGFESRNPFVRNVLYNKRLEENIFLNAVANVSARGLSAGAFVFAGIFPLNDAETLADAKLTLDFLHDKSISPVVMFPNIQAYTIQELLFVYHENRLMEPRTILEVLYYLVRKFSDKSGFDIDPWLIADPVGGPPPPRFNIFSTLHQVTCEKCSQEIHRSILLLRQTRDIEIFIDTYNSLSSCKCASDYLDLITQQLKLNSELLARTEKMIETTKAKLDDYISVVRPLLNENDDFALFKDNVPRYSDFSDPFVDNTKLKAELLCYGVRISPDLIDRVKQFNSYIHEAGFVHAAHFMIGDHVINSCVAESFCGFSPFELKSINGHFELNREDKIIAPCEILTTPEWCFEELKEYKLGDIIRPHSQNVISGMPNPVCCYFQNNVECAFCSLKPYQNKKPIPPEVVAEAAIIALKFNPNYQLALSGGTPNTPDRGALYFSEIARLIKRESSMAISVELVPPQDKMYMDELKESGISSLIMNIEIWDSQLRSVYCPGKSQISIEQYLSAIDYGIKLFGRGQVASVLLAGIQAPSDIIEGAKEIISRGAIPTVIPFKPFDDCKMSRVPLTNATEVVEINSKVSALLTNAQLRSDLQRGCTGCGGCSLENLRTRVCP